MGIIEQIIGAFTVGFVGGAVPGPVLTTAMAESLRRGFAGSLGVVFKAMLSEVIIAASILAVFSAVSMPRSVFHAMSFAGAGVLIWFAKKMWVIKNIGASGDFLSFPKIFLLMFCNGLFWIYWLTVCVPLAFLLGQAIPLGQAIFLAAFEAGWLASTLAVIFVFSRFRPLIMKKDLVATAFKLFSLVFVLFAVRLFMESIYYFAGR